MPCGYDCPKVMTGDLAKGSDSRMDVGDYKMDVKNGCEIWVFNLLNLLPIYFLWTSYGFPMV